MSDGLAFIILSAMPWPFQKRIKNQLYKNQLYIHCIKNNVKLIVLIVLKCVQEAAHLLIHHHNQAKDALYTQLCARALCSAPVLHAALPLWRDACVLQSCSHPCQPFLLQVFIWWHLCGRICEECTRTVGRRGAELKIQRWLRQWYTQIWHEAV